MNPETLVIDRLRAGKLIAFKPDRSLHVPLFWQQSRIISRVLGNVTRAVLRRARAMFVQI